VSAQLESGAGVLINAVSISELELSCEGVGEALITVSAVDTADHTTSVSFSITVAEPNVAPTMRAVPRQECERDSTITVTLTITDQNNDVVNVEVVSRNDAVADGEISTNDVLQISCKQRGLTNLVIGMDDGQGGYTEERVEVAVGQTRNDPENTDEQEDNTLLYGIIIVLVGLVLGAGYWVNSRE
jgi:hypothetical protein